MPVGQKNLPNIPVLYSVALNALEGLKGYVPQLETFQSNLFSKKTSETNVMQYTPKEKQTLDRQVFECLKLLRPFFLMPQVDLILDYFMARFQVHVYHPGFLVEAFLPYHSTLQFVKLIKSLQLKESVWCFLPQDEPFERALLIKTLGSSPAVFQRFQQLPSQFQDKSYLSFYCLAVLDYVSHGHVLDESRMATLMSVVLPGLANPQNSTFQAACQMITSALVSHIKLSPKVNASLVDAIGMGLTGQNVYPSLLCAISICTHQSFSVKSDLSSHSFLQFFVTEGFQDAFVRAVETVSCQSVIGAFLNAAATIAMTNTDSEKRAICTSFLSRVVLITKVDINSLEKLYSIFLEFPQKSMPFDNQEVQAFLQEARRAHFKLMDQIITRTLSSKSYQSGSKKARSAYMQYINATFSGSLTEVIGDIKTTLFLALEHTSASTRLSALKKIRTKLSEGNVDDIPTSVVMARLFDDDDRVALYVLTELVPHFDYLKNVDTMKSIISRRGDQLDVQVAALSAAIELNKESAADINIELFTLCLGMLFTAMKSKSACSSVEKIHNGATSLLKSFGLTDAELKSLKGFVSRDDKPSYSTLGYTLKLMELVLRHASSRDTFVLDMLKALDQIEGFSATSIQYWLLVSVAVESRSLEVSTISLLLQNVTSVWQLYAATNSVSSFTVVKTEQVTETVYSQLCAVKDESALLVSVVSGFIYQALKALQSANESEFFWFDAKFSSMVSPLLSSLMALLTSNRSSSSFDQFMNLPLIIALCLYGSEQVLASDTFTLVMDKIIASLSVASQDYQLCIPGLLTLLYHQNPQVRGKTLQLLEHIKQSLLALKADAWKKPLDISRVYGQRVWYAFGPFAAKNLSHHAAEVLITRILGLKNEILADNGFFLQSLGHIFVKETTKSAKAKLDPEMIAFMVSHILAAPCHLGKQRLLTLVKDLNSSDVLIGLLPLLENSLKEGEKDLVQSFLPSLFSSSVVQALGKSNFEEPMKLFVRVLNKGSPTSVTTALSCVNNAWYTALPSAFKLTIAKTVLSLATTSTSVQISTLAKSTLSNLSIDGSTFAALLLTIFSVGQTADSRSPKKSGKRQASNDADVALEQVSDLGSLICLLELVQASNVLPLAEFATLIPQLLDLLKYAVDAMTTSMAYAHEELAQTVMECIGTIVLESFSKPTLATKTAEDSIRIDLIINTIRVGVSPQTHRSGLRLLSALAPLYPSLMWSNIVPIFTLMGATITKTDDDFTFSIIQKTIESVLHPLLVSEEMRAQEQHGQGATNAIFTILDTFTDALTFIPAHRQLSLFVTLIQALGVESSLYAVVFLLLTRFVISRSNRSSSTTAVSNASDLNKIDYPAFASSLLESFDGKIILSTIFKVHALACSLRFSADDARESESIVAHFAGDILDDAITKTRVKLVLYGFILRALKLNDVRALFVPGSSKWKIVEEDMHSFVEEIVVDLEVTAQSAKKTLKVTAALNTCMEDLLMLSISIFPPESFKNVTEGLLKESLSNTGRRMVKRRVLSLLKDRLESLCKLDIDLHSTVQVLTRCLQPVVNDDESADVQLAISCLSLIATYTEHTYAEALTQAAKAICGEFVLSHSNVSIVASGFACLACFIPAVGSRVIPFLPNIVNKSLSALLKHLSDEDEDVEAIKVCRQSAVLLLESCLSHIPHFMSGYLEKIVTFLMEAHRCGTTLKVQRLEELISSNVPARVLYSKIFSLSKRVFTNKEGQSFSVTSLNLLNRIIKRSLPHVPAGTHGDFTPAFTEYFVTIFDYRKQLAGSVVDIPLPKLQDMEAKSIDLFVCYAMKLNDAKFKPLFFKMVEWGSWNPNESHKQSRKDALSRCQVLFHLIDSLFAKLQALFTSYYMPVLDAALSLLETHFVKGLVNDDESAPLWKYIISSLTKFFSYDNADVNTKTLRYKKLANAITEQMGLDSIHGADYEKCMELHLIPCIAELANGISENSTAQESLLKVLNRNVLQHSRHSSLKVRLASIAGISAMYRKCGEDMLPLFPETIPFLAELLEDDEMRVEKSCRVLCDEIEAVLGEPLAPFFESQ